MYKISHIKLVKYWIFIVKAVNSFKITIVLILMKICFIMKIEIFIIFTIEGVICMEHKYMSPKQYEDKLKRVMDHLGVSKYDWDYDRHSAWVSFVYKGNSYRFEHSIENAQKHGLKLNKGTDAFAQIVLSLEDIARMVNRGIYDLQTWVAGMKFLPEGKEIPSFFKIMGFQRMPESIGEIDKKFKEQAKKTHPDAGGNKDDFILLQKSYKQCKEYMENG